MLSPSELMRPMMAKAFRTGTLGQFGEGARERRFAGNLGRARPATKTPKRLVDLDALYQHPRGRQVQNRFSDEGSGQRGPLGQRTSGKPMPVRDESLEPRHIHDRNQRLVRFGQATHRFLKIGEKWFLAVRCG